MKLHLGCGNIVFPGWQNIDNYSGFKVEPGRVQFDLRCPFLYENDTVDFIFSEHFFEHLTREEGLKLLMECNRVMKVGAVIRTSQPNLGSLIDAYNRNDVTNQAWLPKNRCLLINEGLRYWGHKHVYDSEDFLEILVEAGFGTVHLVDYHLSEYPELCNLEQRPYYGEIITEAVK